MPLDPSIPLAALRGNVPMEGPADWMKNAYSLQMLRQNIQESQFKQQQEQNELKRRNSALQVYAKGLPDDQTVLELRKAGLGDFAQEYEDHVVKRNTSILAMDTQKRAAHKQQLDELGGMSEGLLQYPEGSPQRDQAYQSILQLQKQQGGDTSGWPQTTPKDVELKAISAQARGAAKVVEQAQKSDTEDRQLRSKGLKRDANGNLVPLTRDELGPEEVSKLDAAENLATLRKAQTELAEATASLRTAQANPTSPAYQLAVSRLAVAQQNAKTAASRLGLSTEQFEMRAFGTNQGQALPGSILTDEGQPVGSAFQQNVRPTGQQRSRAQLAGSATDNLQTIKEIIQRRPDIFGPLKGRKTDFDVWLGSQDADAQTFIAARNTASDHLAGVFGGRSEAALSELNSAIGQFKVNPAAMNAGLDRLMKTAQRFEQEGTPRTTGSNAAKAAPKVPAVGGKVLDEPTAIQILKEAGGDKQKARALAKQRGYTVQ